MKRSGKKVANRIKERTGKTLTRRNGKRSVNEVTAYKKREREWRSVGGFWLTGL